MSNPITIPSLILSETSVTETLPKPTNSKATKSYAAFTKLLTDYLTNHAPVKAAHWDSWLAAQLGITRQSANRIRRGIVQPKPQTCLALAKLMELEPEQLLSVAGHSSPTGFETANIPSFNENWRLHFLAELDTIPAEHLQVMIKLFETALEQKLQQQYEVENEQIPFFRQQNQVAEQGE